jgi:hypothetical protein
MRVTPSLSQRGRQHAGCIPLTPSCICGINAQENRARFGLSLTFCVVIVLQGCAGGGGRLACPEEVSGFLLWRNAHEREFAPEE